MVRLGCLLMIGLLFLGGKGCYEALKNRSPHEMTCAEANTTAPTAQWLHLKDCSINVLGASYKTRNDKPTDEIYIPLTSPGPNASTTSRVVLKTSDPDIVALVKELAAIDKNNQTAFFSFMAKNAKRMILTKDVKGMVQAGIDKNDTVQSKLAAMNKELAADFVILEEGSEPSLVKSGLMLGGGIVIALLFLGSRGKES